MPQTMLFETVPIENNKVKKEKSSQQQAMKVQKGSIALLFV